MAGGDIGAPGDGTSPISGRPSCVTGRKQACRAMILSAWNAGDRRSPIAWRRSISSGSGAMTTGSSGSGAWSEKAVTSVGPREHLDRHDRVAVFMMFEKERVGREIRAGVVDQAGAPLWPYTAGNPASGRRSATKVPKRRPRHLPG